MGGFRTLETKVFLACNIIYKLGYKSWRSSIFSCCDRLSSTYRTCKGRPKRNIGWVIKPRNRDFNRNFWNYDKTL